MPDTALRAPVSGVRIAAAGDIACDPRSIAFTLGPATGALECRQVETSNQLVGAGYSVVLALGDLQYESGLSWQESYGPSWGRAKAITRPTPGNHEYDHRDADGYFAYFGDAAGDPLKGYYSFDVGGWHLISLNSNCLWVQGCGRGSHQEQWLRVDLAAHRAKCTLAFWHHPRFSSGMHGSDPTYDAFWQALYEAGADVVLVGHDHDYERFAPQDPTGARDLKRGIRQFVVGTGGKGLRTFPTVARNSEVRDATSLGVLELTLGSGRYSWRFVPAVGFFADSGSDRCR